MEKTNNNSRLKSLKNSELFKKFPEKALYNLVETCPEIQLMNDELLCEEGGTQKKMFVILSGKLVVFKSKKIINTLGPGDYLGEMSLLNNKPRSASVRALGPTTILEISNKIFHDHILSDPKAALSMMKTLSSRARHNLELISVENQRLNCLVHDMRNYLVPLSITEGHMDELLTLLAGVKPGQKKRKGWDQLNIGMYKMVMVRRNLVDLIDQTLKIGIIKKKEYPKPRSDIVAFVKETIEDVENHDYVQNKILNVSMPPEPVEEVAFNYLDIKRVLQNLIINAGYASKDNQTIEITLKDLSDKVEISVQDYGEGIPEDIQPLILKERFTTKPSGNGLGLLSCREIVEYFHDGEFGFQSESGKGSLFYMSLPRP